MGGVDLKRTRKPFTYSIGTLVASAVSKAQVMSFVLLATLACLCFGALARQFHQGVCAVIESKLESVSGPLSREILLSNSDASTAIFEQWRASLKPMIGAEKLSLLTGTNAVSVDVPACRPGLFKSTVAYPVWFAGRKLALIQGDAGYLSIFWFIGLLAALIAVLCFALKVMTSRLALGLKGSVIEPILKLSRNEDISELSAIPAEVREIEKNIFELKNNVRDRERENFVLQRDREVAEFAEQVSHDIRSPLAALDVALESLDKFPKAHQAIVKTAVSRIRGIAASLSHKRKELSQKQIASTEKNRLTPEHLPKTIQAIVSEKRLQHRAKTSIEIDLDLDASSYPLFLNNDVAEFQRMISNLVDNSVEAITDQGEIKISIRRAGNMALIRVEDNGPGIPEKILPTLGQRGITYGKPGGSGLGLYHAKMTIEKWQGAFSIQSRFGQGVIVEIRLPVAESPGWFLKEFCFSKGDVLCILDDQPSIYELWKQKLVKYTEEGIQLKYFSSESELEDWRSKNDDRSNVFYLCDYDLGPNSKNGLDVIESQGIQDQAVLVTSSANELDVQRRCEAVGVKMVSKEFIRLLPIAMEGETQHADLVLIDDDSLIHDFWKMNAEKHGVRLNSYFSVSDFLSEAPQYSRVTPIYVDSDLGQEQPGEVLSKEIADQGFEKIMLTTAKTRTDRLRFHWLSGVVDKDFPLGSR